VELNGGIVLKAIPGLDPSGAYSGANCSRQLVNPLRGLQIPNSANKKAHLNYRWAFFIWWSWRDLNPRPEHINRRYYMLILSFI
jgi:hypothetical protein